MVAETGEGAVTVEGQHMVALTDEQRRTLDWLTEPDNPAVAVIARRELLGERDSRELDALWSRRNEYPLVAAILDAQRADGSWDVPSRDYQKYRGSLWQVHLLGEMNANAEDERVQRGAAYAFERQLDDGSWSASNKRPAGSITCLTANVGRALARMGWSTDERVLAALQYCVDLYRELGAVDCKQMIDYQLNGYCHMLTPKVLMFLAEVPEDLWPDGAKALRGECVAKLREKEIFRSLPEESREYEERFWSLHAGERDGLRDGFLAKHPTLHFKEKAGWLRFGYPLSYNSDALEALWALSLMREPLRPEYHDAIAAVRKAGGTDSRWALRNTLNGKMYADVESKGRPSKWVTLRAWQVLQHFSEAVMPPA